MKKRLNSYPMDYNKKERERKKTKKNNNQKQMCFQFTARSNQSLSGLDAYKGLLLPPILNTTLPSVIII